VNNIIIVCYKKLCQENWKHFINIIAFGLALLFFGRLKELFFIWKQTSEIPSLFCNNCYLTQFTHLFLMVIQIMAQLRMMPKMQIACWMSTTNKTKLSATISKILFWYTVTMKLIHRYSILHCNYAINLCTGHTGICCLNKIKFFNVNAMGFYSLAVLFYKF
jgi:hypothetical protein